MTGSSTAGPSTTPTIPRRGLERSSLSAFVVNSAAVGVTYIAQLSIARVVGATSYGYYSYVVAFVTILAYLAALGFDVSLIRLVASYKIRGAWGLMSGVIGYAESRVIGCGSILALLGALIVTVLSDIRPTELRITFLLGLCRGADVGLVMGSCGDGARARRCNLGAAARPACAGRHAGRPRLGGERIVARARRRGPGDGATLASAAAGLALVTAMKRHWRSATLNRCMPESALPIWRRAALPLVLIAVAESAMNRAGATFVALNLWMAVYLRRRLGLVPGVLAITSGSRIAV
jgi:hypothetical protein